MIVGAGILGLITGLVLSKNGYRVSIVDEHQYPNENPVGCRGTTLDGCDARHASVTETMPHALFYRKDSLRRIPSDRSGWKIFEGQATPNELLWMERFSELAGYPELTLNLISRFVSNLNRRGMELWEEIFRHYPNLADNALQNRRILRVCSSVVPVNIVSTFQMSYHCERDQLQQYSRSQVLEKLPQLGLADEAAGAIEVPGFTINVLQLCSNLISYLRKQCDVTFHWSKSIGSLDETCLSTASKIIFASSWIRSELPIFDKINLSVQGVAGCWTKLVNIHSRTIGFKITEKDPLGILNVTPSSDGQDLFITGGFGYCGQRGVVPCTNLSELVELFQTAIRLYLPDEYEASEAGTRVIKFCIRPMTPDGMPIIAQLYDQANAGQQVFFLGGTNAGGFVQAPVLATLVADLIQNAHHEKKFSHIYRSLRLDRNTLIFN